MRWFRRRRFHDEFQALAALLALAGILLPALGHAADDVASLRAELQALKNEYTARVDALEARIRQLETTPLRRSSRRRARRNRAPGARAARQPLSIRRSR